MALRYEKAAFDDRRLTQIIELLSVCFPKSNKFTALYLRWLYNGNPDGPAVGHHFFDDGKLIGQLIGIPQRVILRGAPARVILLLDVAIHPDYRGAGHFLDLARRTADLAAALGFAAVTGVANHSTYRGYPKIGFQDVAGLNARIAPFSVIRMDAAAAIEQADYYRDWTDKTLDWRMSNPGNPLAILKTTAGHVLVDGPTPYPGIRARAVIPRRGLALEALRGRTAVPRPALVIGLEPRGTTCLPLSIPIPERAKPSPLRLIYLDLVSPRRTLDPARVLFSFLDFDVL